MRVTPGMTADNALYNLQQGRAKLDHIQELLASGLNVNRPSDDPILTKQILDLHNKLDIGSQYQSNITKGNTWLSMTNTALDSMSDIIHLARKLAGTITSGSDDQTVRNNVVSQLNELKKQLVDMANVQVGDQYLFGGFRSDTYPFNKTGNAYGGTGDDINIEINKNSTIAINITGDKLLKGTGTYGSIDILQAFDDLATAITSNDVSAIRTQSSNLDAAADQVENATTDVAAKMTRLKTADAMITQNKNTMQKILSDTQNVDYAKAAVELSQQETAFQAALAATAKITQLSLLDYMI